MDLTPINDAPYFSADLTDLTSITEGEILNSGNQLLEIVDSAIEDVDTGAVEGVIVYNPLGNGTWQYSSDQSTWTDVSDAISGGKVLHLALTNYLRYVPDQQNGETATISVQAWDQYVDGSTYTAVDLEASVVSVNGGTTPYSSTSNKHNVSKA